MAEFNRQDYARAATISVNYALELVESTIQEELSSGKPIGAETLLRLIDEVRRRRLPEDQTSDSTTLQ